MGDRGDIIIVIYNYILLYVMFINGWEFLFKLLFTVYAFTPYTLQVSNSLTPLSKNHTLCSYTIFNKSLIFKQIKVWHGICYTMSEKQT